MPRAARGLIVVLAVALAAGACRTVPVRNVTGPLGSAPTTRLTMDEVRQAIRRAAEKLGWQIESVAPGTLTGTLKLRKHVAVVTITHDTSTFTITYKDSTNLHYDGREIHRQYNNWVQNLEAAVRSEIAGLVKG
jgi:hypothetical protein